MCGVVLLAAPALKLVWCLFATVSLWMADGLMLVWRAGTCSHEFLALQIEVEVQSSLECCGLPVLGPHLRVRRHYTAVAGLAHYHLEWLC